MEGVIETKCGAETEGMTKQKLNRDTLKLMEVIKQMDLTDTICKTHETQEEGTPKCGYFVPS